uniref:Uncharacterized protein n=1 Tax=Moniliophthora roreri TaxID=221103 RepID=A0A0W0FW58_MONRR
MLMALLGKVHFIPVKSDSYVSLPRQGGLAYAAQESWVQNDTTRENILFGTPLDEEHYHKVLNVASKGTLLCLTLVAGEKGITLSDRQKARITLARAEILLLDDVLAALKYVAYLDTLFNISEMDT